MGWIFPIRVPRAVPINKTRLVEQHIISRELASRNEGAMILSAG